MIKFHGKWIEKYDFVVKSKDSSKVVKNTKYRVSKVRDVSVRLTSDALTLLSLPYEPDGLRWILERWHWLKGISVSETSGLARGARATVPLPVPVEPLPTKTPTAAEFPPKSAVEICSAFSSAANSRGHLLWCILVSVACYIDSQRERAEVIINTVQ